MADGLLCQYASGELHHRMLALAKPWHERYARRFDWHLCQLDVPRPLDATLVWVRYEMMLDAFRQGYEFVVFIESDAVVVSAVDDLRAAVKYRPLALRYGRAPDGGEPAHYQCGMIYARRDPRVIELFTEMLGRCPVSGLPEEETPWWTRSYCQQRILNEYLGDPARGLIVSPLAERWNALSDVANLVVRAWHSIRRAPEKYEAMERWLRVWPGAP